MIPKHRTTRRLLQSLIFLSGFFLMGNVSSQELSTQPVISIIIDDIGWRKKDDLRALSLPGNLSYAILPQTPNVALMVKKAEENQKDVILHVPMEAETDNHLLGPGALTTKMTRREFLQTLELNLQSVPNAVGLNNHMGSRLTNHELSMHRLMDALKMRGGLFFIDSGTSTSPLPTQTAEIYGITTTRRDVFLDHEQSEYFVRKQFNKLVNLAIKKGSALGIAHPHPVTVETLEQVLPTLQDHGIRLVSISEFMQIRNEELPAWHVSSSPLAEGCEELEAVTIIDLLRRAGVEVVSASLKSGPVKASRGVVLIADTELDQVLDDEFDMVVLPGGLPGADYLDQDSRIHGLLSMMADQDRPIAAICAAPKVLASAGLLQSRRATSYPGVLDQMPESDQISGMQYTGDAVTVDGPVITSRGPGTAMDFALSLIEILLDQETRDQVEKGLMR